MVGRPSMQGGEWTSSLAQALRRARAVVWVFDRKRPKARSRNQ